MARLVPSLRDRLGLECVFVPGIRAAGVPRVIVAGFFPPPRSVPDRQHDNQTAAEICKVTGNLFHDWVDLLKWLPLSTCKAMYEDGTIDAFEKLIKGRSSEAKLLVLDYLRRVLELVRREHEHGNPTPVVIWAGKVVNDALSFLKDLGEVSTTLAFATPWCNVCRAGQGFLSMEGAVHPSAFLQAKQAPEAKRQFVATYGMLEVLRLYPVGAPLTFVSVSARLDENTQQRHAAAVAGYSHFDIPNNNGWLPHELRHIRGVDLLAADLKGALETFQKQAGHDALLDMLAAVPARHCTAATIQSCTKWQKRLGNNFNAFICDSVACRLGDAAFTDQLEQWRTVLGDDRFATFICNSVACRLGDAAFTDWLNTWLSCMPVQAFVALLSKNGIDARYQVMGGFMTWYASNHKYWTQAMTESLCRAVPLPQKGEQLVMVPAQTWLTIVGHNPQKKRGWQNRLPAGDATRCR